MSRKQRIHEDMEKLSIMGISESMMLDISDDDGDIMVDMMNEGATGDDLRRHHQVCRTTIRRDDELATLGWMTREQREDLLQEREDAMKINDMSAEERMAQLKAIAEGYSDTEYSTIKEDTMTEPMCTLIYDHMTPVGNVLMPVADDDHSAVDLEEHLKECPSCSKFHARVMDTLHACPGEDVPDVVAPVMTEIHNMEDRKMDEQLREVHGSVGEDGRVREKTMYDTSEEDVSNVDTPVVTEIHNVEDRKMNQTKGQRVGGVLAEVLGTTMELADAGTRAGGRATKKVVVETKAWWDRSGKDATKKVARTTGKASKDVAVTTKDVVGGAIVGGYSVYRQKKAERKARNSQ